MGPLFLVGGIGMTEKEKEKIRYLRLDGLGYGAIAKRLEISENTVKSFCRRNHLSGVAGKEPPAVCRYCGRPLGVLPKRRRRKFCCEACRRAWWKAHPELIERRAFYPSVCVHCGKEFQSYGNRHRKYCSHECYITERFKKGEGHDEGTV